MTIKTYPKNVRAYVAGLRERYRLADGSLPCAWWLMGRRNISVETSRLTRVSRADIEREAAALAAQQEAERDGHE